MQITVKPVRAKLKRDLDFGFWNKMDPYCIVYCNNQSHRTQVAKGAGKRPSWIDVFSFNVASDSQTVTIELWDKDRITADDYIGKTVIPLTGLQARGSISGSFPVHKDKSLRGQIWVEIALGNAGAPGMYPCPTGAPFPAMQQGYPGMYPPVYSPAPPFNGGYAPFPPNYGWGQAMPGYGGIPYRAGQPF